MTATLAIAHYKATIGTLRCTFSYNNKLLNSFLYYSYIQFLYLFFIYSYIQITSEKYFSCPDLAADKILAMNKSICNQGREAVDNSGQNMNHVFPISNPPLLPPAIFI